MRRRQRIPQLLAALRPYQAERMYLFGSWARGGEDELSDIDIVLIKQTEQPFFVRLQEISRLLPSDIGGVDILVYTPQEFTEMLAQGNVFAEMIVEEGRLLYDRQAEG